MCHLCRVCNYMQLSLCIAFDSTVTIIHTITTIITTNCYKFKNHYRCIFTIGENNWKWFFFILYVFCVAVCSVFWNISLPGYLFYFFILFYYFFLLSFFCMCLLFVKNYYPVFFFFNIQRYFCVCVYLVF